MVITSFGFVIIQATGSGPAKKELLIIVVNGTAPSINRFGTGIESRLRFASVLKTNPLLKLIVPFALPEYAYFCPDNIFT